jgi:hypothetical protein
MFHVLGISSPSMHRGSASLAEVNQKSRGRLCHCMSRGSERTVLVGVLGECDEMQARTVGTTVNECPVLRLRCARP